MGDDTQQEKKLERLQEGTVPPTVIGPAVERGMVAPKTIRPYEQKGTVPPIIVHLPAEPPLHPVPGIVPPTVPSKNPQPPKQEKPSKPKRK